MLDKAGDREEQGEKVGVKVEGDLEVERRESILHDHETL